MVEDFTVVYHLDEQQSIALVEMFKNERWSTNRQLKDVKEMLANSNVVALVSRNNELIAFSRFLSDFVYRAFIYDVIVSTKYRGLNYGEKLLQFILNHRLKDVERIELYCIDSNIPFYEKYGFQRIKDMNLMRYKK